MTDGQTYGHTDGRGATVNAEPRQTS